MTNSQQTAKRFKEVFLNGTWIANTNYKSQLSDLSLKKAVSTIGPLNSIAVLAQHIHYYIAGVKNVLKGGQLEINDRFSFEFPSICTQTEWELFLNKFWRDAEEFASLIEVMSEKQMQQVFIDVKYGNYQRNIDGLIEHSYYHLGQIVLLKKMLSSMTNQQIISY
ncbi:MAG: DUF1572 family protein [Bacteroidetes bacterium]|jgi:hypothetical protein|nr:DUF1572 family protein [Bacteroidota bacterium]